LSSEEEVKTLNVHAAVEAAIENLKATITKAGAEVINRVNPVHNILGLPAYLNSVVLNLLTNAIKYRKPNTSPKIKVTSEEKENFIGINFHDNGLGIDLDKHGNNLFKMYKTFHQSEDSRGVGLFITKTQVEAMGGKIEVESEPGEGSVFSICLLDASN